INGQVGAGDVQLDGGAVPGRGDRAGDHHAPAVGAVAIELDHVKQLVGEPDLALHIDKRIGEACVANVGAADEELAVVVDRCATAPSLDGRLGLKAAGRAKSAKFLLHLARQRIDAAIGGDVKFVGANLKSK